MISDKDTTDQRLQHTGRGGKILCSSLLFIGSLIIFYGLLVSILGRLDKTPRWGHFKHPTLQTKGSPLEVSLHYKLEATPVLLEVVAHPTHLPRRWATFIKPDIPALKASDSGQQAFVFPIPQDPNLGAVQIYVYRREVPTDPNRPLHKCPSIGKPIQSNTIYLLSDQKDLKKWHEARSFSRILQQAYHDGYWKTNKGDPTIIGWFITLLYGGASIVCIVTARQTQACHGRYQWFWWFIAGCILLLGINKQLDLQMLLADVGRTYSRMMGWYYNRKPVQIQVGALFVTVSVGCLGIIFYHLRKAPLYTWVALGSLLLLIGVIGVHLVSLHQLEHILAKTILHIRIGSLLEIFCMFVIAGTARLFTLIPPPYHSEITESDSPPS